jgi:LPS-assembly lipoprotein
MSGQWVNGSESAASSGAGGRKLVIGVLLALLATGCGFHLRTFDLNTAVSSVHISSNAGNFAEAPLRQGLKQAGVAIATVADEAEITVALLDDRRDRRSVAVTDQAQAAEYELDLGVQYSVSGPDGKELIPPRWVETSRIYRVDRVNLVGTNEEQALLEREMVNDLVQQIVRALDAATQELTVAG